MTIEDYKLLAETFESVATIISIIVGGIWIYMRFVRQQERYPNIISTADINTIGKQGDYWIIELIAILENKGRSQHKMDIFNFDLYAIKKGDEIEDDSNFGGQVKLQHLIKKGSFLPSGMDFFFIDPGTSAKYSFLVRVPLDSTFVVLHTNFKYLNRKNYGHTAERTVMLPI